LFSTTSPVAPPPTPLFSSSCIVARGCTPLPWFLISVPRSPFVTHHFPSCSFLCSCKCPICKPFLFKPMQTARGCGGHILQTKTRLLSTVAAAPAVPAPALAAAPVAAPLPPPALRGSGQTALQIWYDWRDARKIRVSRRVHGLTL
jgi:hypothetical protein